MQSIPPIDSVRDILFDNAAAKRFLIERDIISHTMLCTVCDRSVVANVSRESSAIDAELRARLRYRYGSTRSFRG